jgi:arylsulfatase A-like enzyme
LAGVPAGPLPVQEGRGGIPAYQALAELRLPKEYRRLYAAEIRYLDDWVGKLVAGAERAAGSDELIILLTADHGESLGEEQHFFAHGTQTLPSVAHVPFVLIAPGLEPGRASGLVHHVDVLPTLLDLVDVAAPTEVAGVALAPLWRSRSAFPDRVLFTDVGREVSAYRGERLERSRTSRDGDVTRNAFRWEADGSVSEVDSDPELRAAVDGYAERPWNEAKAPHPNRDEIEQLRALGYVEPGSDEPSEAAR